MQGTEFTILGIKLAFSFVALVLIVFVILRPIWLMLRARPDFLDSLNKVSQMALEEEEELEIPSGEAKPDRGGMLDSAKSDPGRTAMMVKQWLKERN